MSEFAAMNFTRTPHTDVLLEIFSASKPGDMLEYAAIEAELQRRLGIRVPNWRNSMGTVAKYLRREHNIIIRAEPTIGYRHLPDVDVLAEGARDRRKSYRHNVRALEKQQDGYKNVEALTPEQKMKRAGHMTILSTIVQFTAPNNKPRLRAPMPANQKRIESGVVPIRGPRKI